MRFRGIALLLGLTALTGCPDGKPKGDLPPLHPAKGKVVRGGQPIGGGLVRFFADSPLAGSGIVLDRKRDYGRAIDL